MFIKLSHDHVFKRIFGNPTPSLNEDIDIFFTEESEWFMVDKLRDHFLSIFIVMNQSEKLYQSHRLLWIKSPKKVFYWSVS